MNTTHEPVGITTVAVPNYLAPRIEDGYGTTLTRIAGDTGSPIALGGLWGLDARHGYSKRQPWNDAGTLAMIEQRGTTPGKLILDGKTWQPILGNKLTSRTSACLNVCSEVRWMPGSQSVMVGFVKTGMELIVFDVLSDSIIKRIQVGGPVFTSSNGGFMGEGNLSLDGSVCVLGDESNTAILVDISTGRVGPRQKVSFLREPATGLDNITVGPLATPSGGCVVCHGSDFVRVYKYGPDLILVPHFESGLKLSHADVGVTPAGREVFVGGTRAWYGPEPSYGDKQGNVAAIDLETGDIAPISAGSAYLAGQKEAADQHCSCRGPRGWVLVTYAGPHETQGRFCQELVAWKLDGSRECVRFGVTRTNETGFYRGEAHGVPSPDGKRVMFASNMQHNVVKAGDPHDVKAYVYELTSEIPPQDVESPALERYYVNPEWTYSPQGVVFDRTSGRLVPLPDVVRMLNKWGPV